jgi:hypothetical protein
MLYSGKMHNFFQWIVAVLNPIVVGSLFPIPLVGLGVSWSIILIGFVVYVIVWMFIWIKLLRGGSDLTIGE